MPGANAIAPYLENWEMECDRYQHYFYDSLDTEEDFFKSTAPSEDIWKKFELLPTPPMSPTRTIDAAAVLPTPDKLGWASKLLTQDEDFEDRYKIDSNDVFGNLSSIIIQDCMWSGFSASHRLEKVVGERPLIKPLPTQTSSITAKATTNTVTDTTVICAPARDCVNPTAVLNIPCNNLKRLTSSGSESRADSSDEDDEVDDEDDDEIDVVTVESRPNRTLVPVTITVTGASHGPGTKRFHVSVHRQQHNYAAPSPDSDHDDDDEDDDDHDDDLEDHVEDHEDDDLMDVIPSRKRPHLEGQDEHLSSASSSSSPSSPHSSDSEEVSVGDRRRNHNFMERKRRKDLRSRFLALRDEIPTLADSTKTPKVVILTQAVDYLLQLHSREHAQAQERRRLRARQQQLLRRLSCLKKGRPLSNNNNNTTNT